MTDTRASRPPACRAIPQATIKEKPRRRVYGSVSSRVRDLAAMGLDASEIRDAVAGHKPAAVDAAIYRLRLREEMLGFAKRRPTLFTIEVDPACARRIAAIADYEGVTQALMARTLLTQAGRAGAGRRGL